MQKIKLPLGGLPEACLLIILGFYGCSKGGDAAPADPCASKNITLTSTVTNSNDACTPNGSIQVAAGGSNGFTYAINNGTFQASNNFTSIAAGNHSVTVKDNAGCTKTITVTVGGGSTPGNLFAAVKGIITNNCAVPGCHSGATPTGGINFGADCNIVVNSAKVKMRAVDGAGTATQMPPLPANSLSQADRDKINQWIAAGGKFTD